MPNDIKTIVEIAQGLITSLGIILAGIWSLWLFLFSRSFAGTLTIALDLKRTTTVNDRFLAVINIRVKNIGRTRVKKDYCYIAASEIEAPVPSERLIFVGTQALDYVEAYPIFRSLAEVEPNEEAVEEVVLALDKLALIKLGVKFKRQGTYEAWESIAVFNLADEFQR